MANKGNQALAVDREAIAVYAQFAASLNVALTETRTSLATAIAYLTSDENLEGGDTDDFKSSISSLSEILATMNDKVDTAASATSKMLTILDGNASAKKVPLDEARKNLAGLKMKIKQEQ